MTTSHDAQRLVRGRHIAQIRAVMNLLSRGARDEDRQAITDARLMLEDSAHSAFRELDRLTRPHDRQTDSTLI